jgi:hypothetical protein
MGWEGELTVGHIDTSEREVDDRRVLGRDMNVLLKPLDVKDQERRQPRNLVPSQQPSCLLSGNTVVLGEDGGDGDLGDDVLFDRVLEERGRGEVDREEEEGRAHGFDVWGEESQPQVPEGTTGTHLVQYRIGAWFQTRPS